MKDTLSRALDKLCPTRRGWQHFRELRSHTGWKQNERYADALAIQCWPSRGLGAVGFELKVDRRDWLRELNKPEKSAAIQRWCKAWWVVTIPEIVVPEELPDTWGLVEVHPKKVAVVRTAPALEPEAPGWDFLCSVLRDRAEAEGRVRTAAYNEGHQVASDQYGGARIEQLENALAEAQRDARKWEVAAESHSKRSEQLQNDIGEFERLAGVGLRSYRYGDKQGGPRSAARAVRLAKALMDQELKALGARLRHLGEEAEQIAQHLQEGEREE